MPDDLELMHLHVGALFTHDARGRLLAVNEPVGNAVAPRVFLGRTALGHVLEFRADMDDQVIAEIESIAHDEPVVVDPPQRPHCGARIRSVLARSAPIRRVWTGPAYQVIAERLPEPEGVVVVEHDESPLMRTLPDWQGEVALRQPFVVAVDDGAAASVCCSVRITPRAHAAGVETIPSARRRGFAIRAVVGWAREVARRGALPLYSTSWENAASQAIARHLHMHAFGVDFHVT